MTCGLVSVQGWLHNTSKNSKGRQTWQQGVHDCLTEIGTYR